MKARFLKIGVLVILILVATGVEPARAGLSILGGIGTPIGDVPVGNFSDVKNVGFSMQARYLKRLAPLFSTGTTIGYGQYSGNRFGATGNSGVKVIPMLWTLQLNLPLPTIQPYVNVNLGGYYVYANETTASAIVTSAILSSIGSKDFGYAVGGGLHLGGAGRVSFQVDLSFHSILTPGKSVQFFNALAGLHIGLGR